jgi:hypothetical protein
MMSRRKSADREPPHVVIIRRPTLIDIVSATATRRAVFAMMPTGLAAAANSDMTLRIPVSGLRERGSRDRAEGGTSSTCTPLSRHACRANNRIATKGVFARTNGGCVCLYGFRRSGVRFPNHSFS